MAILLTINYFDKPISKWMLYSSQKNDSHFRDQKATIAYRATPIFCKQVNHAARECDEEMKDRESAQIFVSRNGVTARHAIKGDEHGITSGWNGGKQLMDTEKRTSSNRPK